MQQIKGSVLRSRMAFVEEVAGKAGVDRVLARMPEVDRAALRMLTVVRWYPFELGKRLDEVIVDELGKGGPEFFIRLGEASAERNLSSLHASFVTKGDPQAFMAKAQPIYALYYETGRREYKKTGEHSGELMTYDAETFSTADCLTVVGWYKKALEMCGAQKVEISEPECRAHGAARCRYVMRWS